MVSPKLVPSHLASSRADWQVVTKHLEDAGREVFQVRQELTGGSKK